MQKEKNQTKTKRKKPTTPSLPQSPPPLLWAQRNSSLPLIWGPMLMKLVINSSLCCRFLYCMCNQMWPSLGFTAISELRECAGGYKFSAARLGSAPARPKAGHSAATADLQVCSKSVGSWRLHEPWSASGLAQIFLAPL